ncbi:MAG: hypothetical protein A2096_12645 [Spirochaetes bacterium GWF1_41_5]|nr:MAG: hypothetical protein A2096_12645 [Spirochaetes bacterium GWF1_41_5]
MLLADKYQSLPADLQKEAIDFIDFLFETRVKKKNLQGNRPCGLAKGEITINKEFYKPMTDEELCVWGIE